ncbi:MAG: biotin/lipoyl-containing protein, partial [Pseudomonadota bacterium]
MLKEINIPDIGDFDDIEIIEVLVSNGEKIEKEQSIITLESEKSTMDIPSSGDTPASRLRSCPYRASRRPGSGK